MTRAFVLLGFDPASCRATRPVGVLAVPDVGPGFISWLPFPAGAEEVWRQRLEECREWTDTVDQWLTETGPAADLIELPASAEEPRDAAESIVDEVLAAGWR